MEDRNDPDHVTELVTAVAHKGKSVVEVADPADFSATAGRYRSADIDVLDECIAIAKAVQPAWAELGSPRRWEILNVVSRQPTETLAEQLTRETGKVLGEAAAEVSMTAPLIGSYRRMVSAFDEGTAVEASRRGSRVFRDPVGVVGVISPWNAPVALSLSKIVPALLAGNTVVLLVSPAAPLAILEIVRKLAPGLPDGVLQALTAPGSALGQHLVAHPDVPMLAFTGSTATGRTIAASAAAQVKNLSLELGGNDPAIVLDDRTVDDALVSGLIDGAFTNAGQICVAVKRVFAPRRIAGELDEALGTRLAATVVGNGLHPDTTMGPVHTAADRDRLRGWIDEASSAGATISQHGRYSADPESGAFLLPTLALATPASTRLVREEQFGPVLPIVVYDDLDTAVAMANDSEYGLASSVWTDDPERGFRVARRISAGTTLINSHGLNSVDPRAPFGGVRQSGLGREGGYESLIAFTEVHTVTGP